MQIVDMNLRGQKGKCIWMRLEVKKYKREIVNFIINLKNMHYLKCTLFFLPGEALFPVLDILL